MPESDSTKSGDSNDNPENAGVKGKTYTDADVNRIVAEEKRKAKKEVIKNQEALQELQARVDELLQGRPIEEIRDEIETSNNRLKSVEDNLKIKEAKYAKDLKEAMDKASNYESQYSDLLIGRALKDAALPKASTPASADLIASILRKAAKHDKGIVSVELDVTEEGVATRKQLTPEAAVAILEANRSQYGPLFSSGISGGAGGQPTNSKGEVDVSQMSMQQYAKARKENPQALGLTH